MPGNRLRLCLCTDSSEPSGVGQHMLALAVELRDEWAVTLAAPGGGPGEALLNRAAALGLALWQLPEKPDDPRAGFERGGFTVAHVHAGISWEGHALAQAARRAGVPLVVRTEHLPYLLTDPAERAAHAEGLTWVDRVIYVSAGTAASHRAAGVDAKPSVIRNGILPVVPRRSRADTRATLGLDLAAPVLLAVARMTPQKGHSTLLTAARAVLMARPDARLLLVGHGPEEDALRHLAVHLGLGDCARFLGRREDVPDLLAAADALVLPSLFEGLPLVVLEAMSAGLPVVATRIPGTDEAVVDGITGTLVPPGEAPALAAALLDLISRPAHARAKGRVGLARFAEIFHAARMAKETQHLYREGLAAIAAPLHTPRSDMPRVRIGFIGAGGIAARHLGVLEQFEDVELVAFADTEPGRAAAVAARYGARAHDSYAALLKAGGLDAVYICVPPFAHGAIESAVILHDLPFFVEKPLAVDLATAESLARQVTARGLVTGVGYHWRYLDIVEEARGLLARMPPQLVSGYWLDATPPPRWWWDEAQSGGQVVEQTTHILDLARHLVGEVELVFAVANHLERETFPGLDVATASVASLRFAGGAIGQIASTCVLGWGHRIGLHLYGNGLAIELTDHDIMVDVGRGRPVRRAGGDPVEREDRDFVDAVKGGPNRIRCPYDEALRTHRLALAVARSAREGTPVRLTSAWTPEATNV